MSRRDKPREFSSVFPTLYCEALEKAVYLVELRSFVAICGTWPSHPRSGLETRNVRTWTSATLGQQELGWLWHRWVPSVHRHSSESLHGSESQSVDEETKAQSGKPTEPTDEDPQDQARSSSWHSPWAEILAAPAQHPIDATIF